MDRIACRIAGAWRGLLMVVLVLSLAGQASALSFNFAIDQDASDWPWLQRVFTPGVVTGVLHGLTNNGANQIPTSIEFTSDVSILGITQTVTTASLVLGSGFTVSNGVITSAELLWNFIDPAASGMQLRFNYNDLEQRSALHWNGGNGPQLGFGNANGFSGLSFSAVPEASLALALVLSGLAVRVRSRQTG